MIIQPLNQDNVNCIGSRGITGGHSTNQDMLLDREGTRVEREGKSKEIENMSGEHTSHEVTAGQGNESNNGVVEGETCLAEVEELVDKRDDGGEKEAEEPHPEGVVG